MKVRYLQMIWDEDVRGRPGELHDIPTGERLEKLLFHRYVEPYDVDIESQSKEELIAEIGKLRAALFMTRDGLKVLESVRQLHELEELVPPSPAPEPETKPAQPAGPRARRRRGPEPPPPAATEGKPPEEA